MVKIWTECFDESNDNENDVNVTTVACCELFTCHTNETHKNI